MFLLENTQNLVKYQFNQMMLKLGHSKFWGSLTARNIMRRSAPVVKQYLDPHSFDIYVDKLLTSISGKRSAEKINGGTKYVFEKVNGKEFYSLVGKEWCHKDNKEGGIYYMDNIIITYNSAMIELVFEYVVVERNKNGNHGRFQPPWK